MRPFLCLLALSLTMSCGAPDGKIENGVEEKEQRAPAVEDLAGSQAPAAASKAEAGSDAAPGAKLDAIPAAFHGTYDEKETSCERPSQYRLVLSGKQLRFHESIGTVAQVVGESATSVSVTADYEGEGEKWQSVRRLELTDDGAFLVVSGDGTRFVRIRCR